MTGHIVRFTTIVLVCIAVALQVFHFHCRLCGPNSSKTFWEEWKFLLRLT